MLHKSLFATALLSGLAFASAAEAGHAEPTIRLGVDMVWGGGHFYPAPVAWYPPPAPVYGYSYAPPPAYGQPYWAGGQRHHRHRHHRHNNRHDRHCDD